ncbi:3-isopropylmalate dehydratase [Chondrus crispus]|uniref:3-isopropylmalate dehydratase n=1 Tax=Chondrus crispus TaxID=2769 RepID=R7QD35_CHOCR|nr:3-isopropylmalate dehydratase [Chondrus crispus]CDF35688.1 3-isopropylmalate dehydratase [Chondrus crispus]|eukprot:XP_005715507.1 3-isopropylmalate dehydratase [Chondrus crispus]
MAFVAPLPVPTHSAAAARRPLTHRRHAVVAVAAPSRSTPTTKPAVTHPMTLTEKLLARGAEKPFVKPGDNVWVNVDALMTHDVCGPPTFGIFKREFGDDAKVWDRNRVIIIPDHYIFTEDKRANRNVDTLRQFATEQDIKYFYDIKDLSNFRANPDYKGVCHIALAQEGHTRSGEILFGTDSHTCNAGAFGMFATGIGNTDAGFILGTGKLLVKVPQTMRFEMNGNMPDYLLAKDLILNIIGDIGVGGATYRAMEFAGSTIGDLSMEERMTLCNMAVEAGGKNGLIAADHRTEAYLAARGSKPTEIFHTDEEASFYADYKYNVADLEPVVAKPHSPDNRALAKECSDVRIDRCYIGSCTGGKTEDFLAAARVLQGRKVAVPTFLVPATQKVYEDVETLRINGETLKDIFYNAGCIALGDPGCAACLGGPSDTFARLNEPLVCVSTTNRNFPGRMGDKEGQIYLASPYTTAASAVTGYVTDPREVYDFDANKRHPTETLAD